MSGNESLSEPEKRPTAGNGDKLSRGREGAISALLTEPTIAGAAKKAGVAESTVHRWLKDPEFQSAYRAARLSVVEAAVGRLQQAAGEAVETLRTALKAERDGDKIRAALGILEHAYRGAELLDFDTRLRAIEGTA
jgi:hypothetical protein